MDVASWWRCAVCESTGQVPGDQYAAYRAMTSHLSSPNCRPGSPTAPDGQSATVAGPATQPAARATPPPAPPAPTSDPAAATAPQETAPALGSPSDDGQQEAVLDRLDTAETADGGDSDEDPFADDGDVQDGGPDNEDEDPPRGTEPPAAAGTEPTLDPEPPAAASSDPDSHDPFADIFPGPS